MSEEVSINPQEQEVKSAIEQKLGRFFDEATGVIVQRKFEKIPLVNRCGDVSRVTLEVIGGEVRTFSVRGENPSIHYVHENESVEIGSAFNTANHAYVVDENGRVWDPITRVWGDIDDEEYRSRLQVKTSSSD